MEAKVVQPKDNTKTRVRQVPANNTDQKVIPLPVAFPKNEIDISWLFLAEHGQDIKWCTEDKAWYIWNGQFWQIEYDEHGKVYCWAKRFIMSLLARAATIEDNSLRHTAAKYAADVQKAFIITTIMDLCKSEVPISLNDFDQNPMTLNVQNGTLDLVTGTLREHRRDDLITKIANVSYDASATCPYWLDFIDWTCQQQGDFAAWKQRMMGSFLTGSTRDQSLFVDYGEGGNGKSTQYGLLQRMLGTGYVVSLPAESLMSKAQRSGAAASPDIIQLKGARLALASEGEDNQHLAAGLAKLLSGGDMIPARPLYGRIINFKATHKIVLFTNHRPVITDMSGGMWRRMKQLPSNASIEEDVKAGRREKLDEDAMTARLDAEMSGILNWLVAGCLEWQRSGIGHCVAVDEATEAYRSDMDIIQAFLDDYLPSIANYEAVATKEMYAAYKEWCEDSGRGRLSKQRFDKYMMTNKHYRMEERHARARFWLLTRPKETPIATPAPTPEQPAQASLETYAAPMPQPAHVQPVTATTPSGHPLPPRGILCPGCREMCQHFILTIAPPDLPACPHCNHVFDVIYNFGKITGWR